MRYELTDETVKVGDGNKLHTLYRIRALKNFTCQGREVCAGDLGGLVEDGEILSQKGSDTAWIFDNASAYSGSKVKDDAYIGDIATIDSGSEIYGNAMVFGLATVKYKSKIYDNAKVYGRANIHRSLVHGNAQVYEKADIISYGYDKLSELTTPRTEVKGNAQIYGTAAVTDGSKVGGNAQIYDKAEVKDSTVIGDAKIYGQANVLNKSKIFGSAQVFDQAKVFGELQFESYYGLISVYDGSKIGGNAQIYDIAQVKGSTIIGDAKIYGQARISNGPKIFGSAQVYDDAKVLGKVQVYDNASVYDDAEIHGGKIHGDAKICKNAQIYGNHDIYGFTKVETTIEKENNPVLNLSKDNKDKEIDLAYELTDETISLEKSGTLHRIRALRDLNISITCQGLTYSVEIKKGTLGGFVESEKNLSQDGNAWIFGDGCVYGDSRIKSSLIFSEKEAERAIYKGEYAKDFKITSINSADIENSIIDKEAIIGKYEGRNAGKTIIQASFIGKNCEIDDETRIYNSDIKERVSIKSWAQILESQILADSVVGYSASIHHSALKNNTVVEKDAFIDFENQISEKPELIHESGTIEPVQRPLVADEGLKPTNKSISNIDSELDNFTDNVKSLIAEAKARTLMEKDSIRMNRERRNADREKQNAKRVNSLSLTD